MSDFGCPVPGLILEAGENLQLIAARSAPVGEPEIGRKFAIAAVSWKVSAAKWLAFVTSKLSTPVRTSFWLSEDAEEQAFLDGFPALAVAQERQAPLR